MNIVDLSNSVKFKTQQNNNSW